MNDTGYAPYDAYITQAKSYQELCQQRVRRGTVLVLDQLIGPEVWPQYIVPELLDLANEYSCMIGQLCVNDMTSQIREWASHTNYTVDGVVDPEPETPEHYCDCNYCGFADHDDSLPVAPPSDTRRGYSLGTEVFEYLADQRDIELQTFDARDWEVAHGFMISNAASSTDPDYPDLRTTDRWRILTETWREVLVQRRADLGIDEEVVS
jgi:hypothetical protein